MPRLSVAHLVTAQDWAVHQVPGCSQRRLLAGPWVVGQGRLRLAVGPFAPCLRPLVTRGQGTVGRGVVVVAGFVHAGGVEGLGRGTGNPAGWPPHKMEDIMVGSCFVSTEMIEEWGPRSQFVPSPLFEGGQSNDKRTRPTD